MLDLNFFLLYVDSPARSADFYGRLLGHPPVESSPTFALFKLASGAMLGLWSRGTVEPTATPVGGSELGFAVGDDATVRQLHARWSEDGMRIMQAPQQMDFGFTFTALDPDGHRLRVFSPSTP
ncbi:VOC family protein [Variovorax sp. KK3]|uniref:VOC family protein n=1 Tax=Variovorax sp. KK3 TaxID=1855728 RepID=UPI00097BD873|nr:VOC family protein [Variovorax sp. KK3]